MPLPWPVTIVLIFHVSWPHSDVSGSATDCSPAVSLLYSNIVVSRWTSMIYYFYSIYKFLCFTRYIQLFHIFVGPCKK